MLVYYLQAYERAIERAVARCKAMDGEAHAIDIGTGSGLLSVLAARAGADSVLACDLHEPLANVARRVGNGSGFMFGANSQVLGFGVRIQTFARRVRNGSGYIFSTYNQGLSTVFPVHCYLSTMLTYCPQYCFWYIVLSTAFTFTAWKL